MEIDDKISKFKNDAASFIEKLYTYECSTDSEESSVFKTKYKIRSIFVNLLDMVKRIDPTLKKLRTTQLWGFLTLKLALNYIETDEPSNGRKHLHNILTQLRSRSDMEQIFEILDVYAAEKKCDLDLNQNVLRTMFGLLQICYNSLAVISTPSVLDADDKSSDQLSVNWLFKAESVFLLFVDVFKTVTGCAPDCWESLGFTDKMKQIVGIGGTDIELIKELLFQSGYTTTIFMLAQAYANDGECRKSAICCQKTLQRQLMFQPTIDRLLESFNVVTKQVNTDGDTVALSPTDWLVTSICPLDPVEWSSNAANLSQFYTAEKSYAKALECLMSAFAVLGQHKLKQLNSGHNENNVSRSGDEEASTVDKNIEKNNKTEADIARHTVKYALALLEAGIKYESVDTDITKSMQYGSLFNVSTKLQLLEAYGSPTLVDVSEFSGNSYPSSVISALSSVSRSFESASILFRWISRNIKVALSVYTLDEHCTEAVDLMRANAHAYLLLANYEADMNRKACMKKRCIDILASLLDQLNPRFYMSTCRQLMFEIAEALTQLRDVTEIKIDSTQNVDEKVRLCKKVNLLSNRAIQMYKKYVDSFRKPVDNSIPDFYEDASLRLILLAFFYSARLHSKMIKPDIKSKLAEISASLTDYQSMVILANKHINNKPELEKVIGEEVKIAREMIDLLPAQISKMSSLALI